MKISGLHALLLFAAFPGSAAFLAKAPKDAALALKPASQTTSPKVATSASSNTGLSAWHDHVRNDPYTRSRNGEVGLLQSDYYYPQSRVGSMVQPYARGQYRDNLGYSSTYRSSYGYGNGNDYYGPYANTGTSRRYGTSNYDYSYLPNSYYGRRNSGRFPSEEGSYGSYYSGRNGYGSGYGSSSYGSGYGSSYGSGYGSNYGSGYGNNYYGRNAEYGYGMWRNNGHFPPEDGYQRNYYGTDSYDYGSGYGRGYGSGYGSSRNGYSGDYSYGSGYGYGRRY